MEGWAGGRDCDRRRARETAGERDEAWRKKTVNEALFWKLEGIIHPKKKIFWAFLQPNALSRKTESDLDGFV